MAVTNLIKSGMFQLVQDFVIGHIDSGLSGIGELVDALQVFVLV